MNFFYIALTLMVIYTIVFFWVDLKDYINKGGSFGEAMTNQSNNSVVLLGDSFQKPTKGKTMDLKGFNEWDNFRLSFVIKPLGTKNGWTNIIHNSFTNKNCCGEGDRWPAIWFFSNSTRMHIRLGRWKNSKSWNNGANPYYHLPINKESKVVLDVRDTRFNLTIYNENNEIVFKSFRVIPKDRLKDSVKKNANHKFYFSDPWHNPSNVEVKNMVLETVDGAIERKLGNLSQLNANIQTNNNGNALIENNPNIKKAIESGRPSFMQGVMKAMPSLMNAYNKSQPDLNKAKPHLLNAYEQAEPHLMQARPHLQSAFMKAQPDIKNAFDNSFNDFNEAYQKSRPYIGAEVINMGQRIRGSPNSVTENVMGGNKNNSLTHASQSAETPLSTQTFNVNNTEYSTLSNGLIAKKGKGVCPNGCLAPQYDNDLCSNEIFMDKKYRNCPWVSDGSIDDSSCDSCGSILIPKNRYGYARTRPGLFNDKSIKMALQSCKIDKESDNLDYEQIGKDFMDDLSRIKRFREPRLRNNEYRAIGRVVYKYEMDKLNSNLYKNRLTDVLNNVLNSTTLQAPLEDRYTKYRGRRKCGEREIDPTKVRELKSIMGDLKYQAAVDGAENEMKSDNRLGGSKTAYTTKYKPVDPNKFPRPYDAIWSSR